MATLFASIVLTLTLLPGVLECSHLRVVYRCLAVHIAAYSAAVPPLSEPVNLVKQASIATDTAYWTYKLATRAAQFAGHLQHLHHPVLVREVTASSICHCHLACGHIILLGLRAHWLIVTQKPLLSRTVLQLNPQSSWAARAFAVPCQPRCAALTWTPTWTENVLDCSLNALEFLQVICQVYREGS